MTPRDIAFAALCLTPGGTDNATASWRGWFLRPALRFSRRFGRLGGYEVSARSVRTGSLAHADGHTETGSTAALTLNARDDAALGASARVDAARDLGATRPTWSTGIQGLHPLVARA